VTLLSRALCEYGQGLFVAGTDQSHLPHSGSQQAHGRGHLAYFEFVGRFLAKCLLEGELVGARFAPFVYKRILGRKVTYRDMAAVDEDFYKHRLLWLRDNDITGILFEDFTYTPPNGRAVELCPGGARKAVCEGNKLEYLDLLVEYRLSLEREPQLRALLQGFYSLVSARELRHLTEGELAQALEGEEGFDLEDLKDHARYTQGAKATTADVQMFWRVLGTFSPSQKGQFLQFVTGCPRGPLVGASGLDPLFTVQRVPKTNKLPTASTCFNRLKLPAYGDEGLLRRKLLTAIEEGAEGFAFT